MYFSTYTLWYNSFKIVLITVKILHPHFSVFRYYFFVLFIWSSPFYSSVRSFVPFFFLTITILAIGQSSERRSVLFTTTINSVDGWACSYINLLLVLLLHIPIFFELPYKTIKTLTQNVTQTDLQLTLLVVRSAIYIHANIYLLNKYINNKDNNNNLSWDCETIFKLCVPINYCTRIFVVVVVVDFLACRHLDK